MYFVKLYIALSVSLICNCKLLPLNQTDFATDSVLKCLKTINKGHFLGISHKYVVTNFVELLRGNVPWMTVQNTSEIKCLLIMCPKINAYILDLRHESSEELLNHLAANHMFNPTALFAIFINSIEKFNLHVLANRYVDKVLLLDKNGSIFSYFPYKYGNVNNPDLALIKIGLCNSSQELNLAAIGHRPKTWENTTVNVLFRVTAPYVTGNNDGMEENCIKLFKKYLKVNASIEYLQFGVRLLENKTIILESLWSP